MCPPLLPYAAYRPLVRLAHYAGLRRVLRSGRPVVVHDCGTQTWVRRWLAREARRRGAALHLLVLDVAPEEALAGQLEQGRGVSRYAFRPAPHGVRPAAGRGGVRPGAGGLRLGGARRPGRRERPAPDRLHRLTG